MRGVLASFVVVCLATPAYAQAGVELDSEDGAVEPACTVAVVTSTNEAEHPPRPTNDADAKKKLEERYGRGADGRGARRQLIEVGQTLGQHGLNWAIASELDVARGADVEVPGGETTAQRELEILLGAHRQRATIRNGLVFIGEPRKAPPRAELAPDAKKVADALHLTIACENFSLAALVKAVAKETGLALALDAPDRKVTLELSNVTLAYALEAIAYATGTRVAKKGKATVLKRP